MLLCDAFVFAFGATITWYSRAELRLLRWAGKRIVFVYHGSDSRPPYLDGQALATALNVSVEQCAERTAKRKKDLEMLDALADEVIDNPFSALLHSRSLVNWHIIGIPSNLSASDAPIDSPANARVRILHGPSHAESKGTPLIREAIARLIEKGREIDYVEVIGQPHASVVAELKRCDLVIDQAYADVPMAGFSTEAATFGKPSIVGGLGGDFFHASIPDDAYPPVMFAHPDDFENAIDKLVSDRALRIQLGEAARKFIIEYREPAVVAARMIRVLKGDVPNAWRFDPSAAGYVGGFGPPHLLRPMINEMVRRFGSSVLQLDDKPALRDRVIDFWITNDGADSTLHS